MQSIYRKAYFIAYSYFKSISSENLWETWGNPWKSLQSLSFSKCISFSDLFIPQMYSTRFVKLLQGLPISIKLGASFVIFCIYLIIALGLYVPTRGAAKWKCRWPPLGCLSL
ncbi:MAG: hypothetical protein [Cressdnaviricota sp.]|nr:MAG: hypothetical protein [Cressdnaviricota sp.]